MPLGGEFSWTSCTFGCGQSRHIRMMHRPSFACGMHCGHSVGNECAWSFGVDPWMVYLWTCNHLNDLPTDRPLMKSTAAPLRGAHSSSKTNGAGGALIKEENSEPATTMTETSMATSVVANRMMFERAWARTEPLSSISKSPWDKKKYVNAEPAATESTIPKKGATGRLRRSP